MGKSSLWVLAAWLCMAMVGCGPKSADPSAAAPAGSDAPAIAAAPAAGVTFDAGAKAVFEARCASCHIEQQKGGLSLASLESAMTGGKSGPVVVAGSADTSLLFAMVSGTAEKRMPPKGDPLSDAELAAIKAWIDGGAH